MFRNILIFATLVSPIHAFAVTGYEANDFVDTITKRVFDTAFAEADIPSPLDIHPDMAALKCLEAIGGPSVEIFNTSTTHWNNVFFGMPWGRVWTFTPEGYFYSGEIHYDRPGSVVEKTMRIIRDKGVFIVKEKVLNWGTGWHYSPYMMEHPESYVVCGACTREADPNCPN